MSATTETVHVQLAVVVPGGGEPGYGRERLGEAMGKVLVALGVERKVWNLAMGTSKGPNG